MKKTLVSLLGLAVTLGAALLSGGSRAQTVQGDVLRGQGRFLEGAGWYNLNTARADRINVETWKSYNREVQRLYRDYMIDRYHHIQYKKGLTNKVQQDYQRKFEEAQRRWRTNPNADDINTGDALNALAGDLADPSVAPSSWRTARVDLPPEMSLTALAFKISDKKKASLAQSTIAVDRMLVKDGWPLAFRRPEMEAECGAFAKAVAAVVAKCRRGTELKANDYDRLRDAVSAVAKKLETAIPLRDNQRAQARAFVKRLDDATRLFADQAYAEQLVRDVSEHRATTVAELLAFMRQYRLLFSDSGDSPEVASLYEGLYGLLRQQSSALGLEHSAVAGNHSPAAASDPLRAGSIWNGTLTFKDEVAKKAAGKKAAGKKAAGKKAAAKQAAGIAYKLIVKERNGNQFTGESIMNNNAVRNVEGTIDGGRVTYRESDSKGNGFGIDGTIKENTIIFKFGGRGAQGKMRIGEGRITSQ
jgi:hypothetical protein